MAVFVKLLIGPGYFYECTINEYLIENNISPTEYQMISP